VRDILARDNQVLAAIVAPAQHDMRVRMAGVEMVDRDPFEPGAQVLLHLPHQPARERLEVGILVAVLDRDDEAELVTVASAALDVAQVRLRSAQAVASQHCQPRLDDHPARAERGMAIARAQHARAG
jgi:hypothetical protein